MALQQHVFNHDTETVNPYIKLACSVIEQQPEMLTIQGFVNRTGYKIDALFVDEQWAMMNSQQAHEMKELTLQMLQRLKFTRNSTLVNKIEHLFPAPRVKGFYRGDSRNVIIENLAAAPAAARSKHGGHNQRCIKMTKAAYKELLMETQTEAARQVRKYYICLEELFTQYLMYQQAHELVRSRHQMQFLQMENKELSDKLDQVISQNEHMLEQNEELKKQGKVQLLKLDMLAQIINKETDNKVVDLNSKRKKQNLVVLQNRRYPNLYEILRGQQSHTITKTKRKHQEMNVVDTIETYMNPINLYNRFSERVKKERDERFEVKHNRVIVRDTSTTTQDLLDILHELDDEKKTIARKVYSVL